MENITIAAQVIHKHMTEAQWNSSDYIPTASEVIVYDEDSNYPYPRQKIGNGKTLAKNLPFINHTFSKGCTVSGIHAHVQGENTVASGQNSHAEGLRTTAIGSSSHVEGISSIKAPEGTTASNAQENWNTSEKKFSAAVNDGAHVEGANSLAIGKYSHAEGYQTHSMSEGSHSEGRSSKAKGDHAHAEGNLTEARGMESHAEGLRTIAEGDQAHAEGQSTMVGNYVDETDIISKWESNQFLAAFGEASHAEGRNTLAMGNYSHTEGTGVRAIGEGSHAEGGATKASGEYAHAEGQQTTASGKKSHAEGYATCAGGNNSHAEGEQTQALGYNSHTEGRGTIVKNNYQHAQGRFNIYEISGYSGYSNIAHFVGNGTSDTERSNAHTLDFNGNAWYAGDVYVGGNYAFWNPNSNKMVVSGAEKLAKVNDTVAKSVKAEQLETAHTFRVSGGVTSNYKAFNGTTDIDIEVTKLNESYLVWGNQVQTGKLTPIDMAISSVHSANRLALANPEGIFIEYGRYKENTTEVEYKTYEKYSYYESGVEKNVSVTATDKINLVSNIGRNSSPFYVGARCGVDNNTRINQLGDQLRITLDSEVLGIYTRAQKMLININTQYATDVNVKLEAYWLNPPTASNGEAQKEAKVYYEIGTYKLAGWSGWNSIPLSGQFFGNSSAVGNISKYRLTFYFGEINSTKPNTNHGLQVLDICLHGDTYWLTPSTLARTGHLYDFDANKNAFFPSSVVANKFQIGNSSFVERTDKNGLTINQNDSTLASLEFKENKGVLHIDRLEATEVVMNGSTVATQAYVGQKIAEIQTGGSGATVDLSNYYTIEQTDNKFVTKENIETNYFSSTQIQQNYYDKTQTYTQEEVNNLINSSGGGGGGGGTGDTGDLEERLEVLEENYTKILSILNGALSAAGYSEV